MKKLSKKQKLVGFIAILIVAVIIAIVITTSVIKQLKNAQLIYKKMHNKNTKICTIILQK